MAGPENTPSSALLRLRPADVVRLCGLNAAATGIDLAESHNVVSAWREGGRLRATVNDMPPRAVWVEIPDELTPPRWECACGMAGPLACAHVAATLTAWIDHPSDFMTAASDAPPTTAEAAVPTPSTAPPIGTHLLRAHDAHSASDDSRSRPPARERGESRAGNEGRPGTSGKPATDETTLAAALARMSATDVSPLARRILASPIAEDPATMRQELLATLSDPLLATALLQRLDESVQALYTLLDLAGGAMTTADLDALATRLGCPVSALQSDVAVLERHGLLLPMLPTSAPSEYGPGATWRHVAGWRIPDEVRRAITSTLPIEPINPEGGALRVTHASPRTLCLALALLAAGPPPLGLAMRDEARDEPMLSAERLAELARTAGLPVSVARLARLLLRQTQEKHAGTSPLDMAHVPVSERPVALRAAFRRWLRMESSAELIEIETISDDVRVRTEHNAPRTDAMAREVSDARRFVARLLRAARPETWYPFDDLLALAWQVRPGFLRGQQQNWVQPAWWLESQRERRMLQPAAREDWMRGEGVFIRALLLGVFAIWGAVDLAAREDDNLAAFRLTPLGAWLLRRDDVPADEALAVLCAGDWGPVALPIRDGGLAVQPLAADPQLLDALALWAAPTAISGKRLLYTLSPDRAAAAFDQGRVVETLLAMLRPLHSRAGEAVAQRLQAWHAVWGRTRLTKGFTLIEAPDEATLIEALAASPEVAARCRRIGPGLALVLPGDVATLRTVLQRRGYAL